MLPTGRSVCVWDDLKAAGAGNLGMSRPGDCLRCFSLSLCVCGTT